MKIKVAAAIIQNADKFLICQRPKGKKNEWLWEFPGGKCEKNETLETCLIRECKEELDILIKISHFVGVVEWEDVEVGFYLATISDGTIKVMEHNAIKWCKIENILAHPLCPADKIIVEKIWEVFKNS